MLLKDRTYPEQLSEVSLPASPPATSKEVGKFTNRTLNKLVFNICKISNLFSQYLFAYILIIAVSSLSPSAGSVDAPENVPSDLEPATSAPPSTKRKPPPPPLPALKAKGT